VLWSVNISVLFKYLSAGLHKELVFQSTISVLWRLMYEVNLFAVKIANIFLTSFVRCTVCYFFVLQLA
jgi:hypothetical protein